jgi:4-alpha-glucanotransferase
MHWRTLRVVLRSTARLAVVPVQDIIGFGEGHRMNTPGTSEGNWLWRLEEGDLRDDLAEALREMNRIYRR